MKVAVQSQAPHPSSSKSVDPDPLIMPRAYSSTLAVTSWTCTGICFVIALADSRASVAKP